MIKVQTLKGFRDFLPEEEKKRQYVIGVLKNVFELYGFEPLETPTLEYEEILTGKYGQEGDKLMYKFEDLGKRKVALRYDQTVPLARVIAQYQNDLPMPFKRYQIQSVFRAENTQKGRYREFLQCDADIVGSNSTLSDAEVIATAVKSIETLGFKNYKVLINDRNVFEDIGKILRTKFPRLLKKQLDLFFTISMAVDKIKKIYKEGVIKELTEKGLLEQEAKTCLEIVANQKPTDRTKEVLELLKILSPEIKIEFSSTLARGLNYYTSTIFEIEIEDYNIGSVCGGGRYDKLIGVFSNRSIPAVGFAFGFDRIIEAMTELKLFPAEVAASTAKVLVTVFNEELINNSLELASFLRQNNIKTELYLDFNAGIDKQWKYANRKNIPFMAVLGEEELKENKIKLQNMKKSKEEDQKMTKEELLGFLKTI